MDVLAVIESFRNQIQAFLEAKIVEHGPLTVQFSGFANLSKPIAVTKVSCHANGYTKPVLFLLTDNDYLEMVDQIVSTLQVFCSTGSGFIIESLEPLDIKINQYKPIRGSSYVPTPAIFKNKIFLLNIQNKHDNLCFAYSVLAALNPSSSNKKQDLSLYQNKMHQLDISQVKFSMSMTDIPKFEASNHVAIKLFVFDNKEIIPLFLSKSKNKRISLLLIKDGVMYHYCLITNFNASMSRQFESKTYCRNGFSSQTVLLEHVKLCGQYDAVSIKMPPEKSFISFRHWFKTSLCPFTIYADTEAICQKKINM